jgi:hypothetical protein
MQVRLKVVGAKLRAVPGPSDRFGKHLRRAGQRIGRSACPTWRINRSPCAGNPWAFIAEKIGVGSDDCQEHSRTVRIHAGPDPDFLHASPDRSAYAAFFTEGRMKFAMPLCWKGSPGQRKGRDLQFHSGHTQISTNDPLPQTDSL